MTKSELQEKIEKLKKSIEKSEENILDMESHIEDLEVELEWERGSNIYVVNCNSVGEIIYDKIKELEEEKR